MTEEQKRLSAEEWWAEQAFPQTAEAVDALSAVFGHLLQRAAGRTVSKETCAALVNESSALRTWFNFTALAATPGCVDA